MRTLPDQFKRLVDAKAFAVVGTVNPDGSPQTSVLWAAYDGEEILLSTIEGRAKHRNWLRDPRTSVIVYDPANPYTYVEVRGEVRMTHDGGPELIDRLSRHYTGQPWTADDGTGNVRVVARITPAHVASH